MLCKRCLLFWEGVMKQMEASSEPPAKWVEYSMPLHARLSELLSASQERCFICRAVHSCLTEGELHEMDPACSIDLDLDLKEQGKPFLHAQFIPSDQEKPVLRRLAIMYSGELDDCKLATVLRKCAKLENDSTGSEANLTLASFWLDRCQSEHVDCPKPKPFLPSRVVDVGPSGGSREPHLLDTRLQAISPAEKRYIALSYCWGRAQTLTTKQATLQERMEGIPVSMLPQTLKDAVTVTRRLGFRYIWIDALCIIQDSHEDWEAEAATMCDVYRYASLTIAATHASSVQEGCFYSRDGTPRLPFLLDIPGPVGRHGLVRRTLWAGVPRNGSPGKPDPILHGRSWVLQETLLSRRILGFDSLEMSWQCLTTPAGERSPNGGGYSRVSNNFADIQKGIVDTQKDFFDESFWYRRGFWCETVNDYTHRGMTKSTDRLIAISGVASAIGERTSNVYLAGLWKDQLPTGLLWGIPFYQDEHPMMTPQAHTITPSSRHTSAIAPSWSWASVTVPVVHLTPQGREIICEILGAEVNGTPSSQSGTIRIRANARTLYVKSVYSWVMQEACASYPALVADRLSGLYTHQSGELEVKDFFLASLKQPKKDGDFQPMPGTWRPDEILDPRMPITFIALAQHERSRNSLRHKNVPVLPEYEVYTIGLLPTGRADGEYRRVGSAVWHACAWYGYDCGTFSQIRHKSGFAKLGSAAAGSLWEKFSERNMDLRYPRVSEQETTPTLLEMGKGKHNHPVRGHPLPDHESYHKTARVNSLSVAIV